MVYWYLLYYIQKKGSEDVEGPGCTVVLQFKSLSYALSPFMLEIPDH